MSAEIAKVYNPKDVEDRLYSYWENKGFFRAEPGSEPDRKKYCIVIPPPNVTDRLHMGHAYNNTIQDILIRYFRMLGHSVLWLPGTDHAGIATQNVVERMLLKEENISRQQLGREKFIKRVWQWREKYGDIIIEQLKKLGSSCDWSRTRFTMDEGLSSAVIEAFVRLYQDGLIYRGKYIVNWCPRCRTAISDEEVNHQDKQGSLWYIRYPVKGSGNFITVATTRPETMLGDTGVAVHPDDTRYKKYIGKTVLLPVMDREIPIFADMYVDPKFGTGAVKVTPAHDPNDFDMGKRHNLPALTVIGEDGKMNENAGKYKNLDRFKARKELVEELKKLNLLDKIEKHQHSVGNCQRCDTIIEPYLSEQWFVKIKDLAKPALDVVKEGKVSFVPERWTRTYTNWMENIRDWCISRQLWWGHRIPVYYCKDCREMMVLRQQPEHCSACGGENLYQDSDVLDTWFSSWLWPFSTMGWPEDSDDLKNFYPTNTLVTGPDIIFFWVARMIMAGLKFRGDIPFRHVYINGLIRDEFGQKMSKSRGNGIDPLEMIEKYSADAIRFSMMALTSEGQDVSLSESKFEMGRNFSNKIWNAFRFLAMNCEDASLKSNEASLNCNEGSIDDQFSPYSGSAQEKMELADRWIVSRYDETISKNTEALKKFRFNDYINDFYSFFWHDFCDWYLELIKPRLYNEKYRHNKKLALNIAFYVLKGCLKLIHPVMPFITEEIWQKVRSENEVESIMISDWPEPVKVDNMELPEMLSVDERMNFLKASIGAIRNIRSEMNVQPNKKVNVIVGTRDKNISVLVDTYRQYYETLAGVATIKRVIDAKRPPYSASSVVAGVELFIPLAGLIDIETEKNRLQKEISRLEELLEKLNNKLVNQNFLSRAPKEVINKERGKKKDFEENLKKIKSNFASLIE